MNRYFGEFNRFRRDRWVFGDRDSGAYRTKFAWTNDTGWSRAVRLRMIPSSPSTGLTDGAKEFPRPWTNSACVC